MISYVEYLNIPITIALIIIGIFFIIQIIGEILEFKGKVVPECLKVRKYFKRKKQERETMHEIPETLAKVQTSLDEMNKHYSLDNIRMRDEWIRGVNEKLDRHDAGILQISAKLDKTNQDTLAIRIDNMRNTIINFASIAIDESKPVTREQYNRIFKMYQEYENMIRDNNMVNGEIDIAHRMIMESYEKRMRAHSFIEDVRGYTQGK